MPRKQKVVEAALQGKGFQESGGDHRYFHYYSKAGKKTAVFTKTSHGNSELNDFLLGCMAKQCRLTRQKFELLVDCPLDRDSYEALLVEAGVATTA